MTEGIIGAIGTIAVGLLTYLGARIQAKMSRSATAAQVEGSAIQAAVQAWQEIAADTRTRLDEAEHRLSALTQHTHEQDRQIGAQERRITDLSDRLARWSMWGLDLVDRWDHHRSRAEPPHLPEMPTPPNGSLDGPDLTH